MPQCRRICSCTSGSAPKKFWPSISISPAAGSYSPIMCLSNVLLPQPLPPMMTKISPRLIAKLRSRWITRSLCCNVTSRTSICTSDDAVAAAGSDAEFVIEDIQRRVGDNEIDNGVDHCASGGLADGGGTTPALQPGLAPGGADEQSENNTLDEAGGDIAGRDGRARLIDELHKADVHAAGDQRATNQAERICQHAQQRHYHDQREHA